MMIAEILLTIAAFKKGWRGRALLPMGFVLGMGIIAGFVAGGMGVSNGTIQTITLCMLPVELTMIGILCRMASRGPGTEAVSQKIAPLSAIESTGGEPESVPA